MQFNSKLELNQIYAYKAHTYDQIHWIETSRYEIQLLIFTIILEHKHKSIHFHLEN